MKVWNFHQRLSLSMRLLLLIAILSYFISTHEWFHYDLLTRRRMSWRAILGAILLLNIDSSHTQAFISRKVHVKDPRGRLSSVIQLPCHAHAESAKFKFWPSSHSIPFNNAATTTSSEFWLPFPIPFPIHKRSEIVIQVILCHTIWRRSWDSHSPILSILK